MKINDFTISDNNGLTVKILDFGATIYSIEVPDKKGKVEDVTLGYKSPEFFSGNSEAYFGSSVGRFANRIRNASFKLNDKIHKLNANWRGHTLHGGEDNLSLRFWSLLEHTDRKVKLSINSRNGDQGFPGELRITAVYEISETGCLKISYNAIADQTTPVNLTNHVYFNLGGQTSADIKNHKVQIFADHYLPCDSDCIADGRILGTKGSLFDFNEPVLIKERLDPENCLQQKLAGGFDHSFIVKGAPGEVVKCADIIDEESGRKLEVKTDAPCLHFYTGNNLLNYKNSRVENGYSPYSGFCLETQGFINFPNTRCFPQSLVSPENPFNQITVYGFSLV